MINFRYFVLFVLLFCSFTGNTVSVEKQNKAFRNFWHPTFHGERLDYCTLDGKACGQEVADKYCQMLGYEYSNQNEIAYNLGLTHFLGTSVECKGWRCNGFMTISCASEVSHQPPKPYHYREKCFTDPRFNDYRVDWCYSQNQSCGRRAANSFCSRMGYIRAKAFIRETQIGATKTIGSQELCFGNKCDAFKMIVCYR